MGASIGNATPLPKIDYTKIERDIRDEHVSAAQPQIAPLEKRVDELNSLIPPLDKRERNREGVHDLATVGAATGVIIGGGAAIGGVVGLVKAGGMSGIAKYGSAGAIIGLAAVGAMFMLESGSPGNSSSVGALMLGKHAKPNDDSRKLTALKAEFRTKSTQLAEVQQEATSYGEIKPGQRWMDTPIDNRDNDPKLSDYVETVFADHDHDRDGQIRVNDSSNSPKNERIRNPQGGAVNNDREQSVGIEQPYRLTDERIKRFDTNHDGALSRREVATGMILDSRTDTGGLYWNLDSDHRR